MVTLKDVMSCPLHEVNDLLRQGRLGRPRSTPQTRPKGRSAYAFDTVESQLPQRTGWANLVPLNRSWRNVLEQDVARGQQLELQLLALNFTTGIVDATTFAEYQVFATKQTGNAIFLALTAVGPAAALGGRGVENILASIVAFSLGSTAFSSFGRQYGSKSRVWLLVTTAIQSLLGLIAVMVKYWSSFSIGADGVDAAASTVIALLAFASAGQVVMAHGVGLLDLNTTMITGTLVQLARDPRLFWRHNSARMRNLAFVANLVTGCLVGAMVHRQHHTLGLLLAVLLKSGIAASLLLNERRNYASNVEGARLAEDENDLSLLS